MHRWSVFPEFNQASVAAAGFLVNEIRKVISTHNECHIALPGGKSPVSCLGYLAKADLPWEKVHWYTGDERYYPKGHAERNEVM